jgi:hypothetical protein
MAITPTIWRLPCENRPICRAFVIGEISGIRRGYARIGTDMQRVRHFSPEVPEIEEAGSSSPAFALRGQMPRAPYRRSAPPRPARSRPATR